MTCRTAAAVALVIAGSLGAAGSSWSQGSPALSAAAPTLAAAFALVYPNATVEIGSDKVQFHPALIERVGPYAFALVSAGQVLAAAGNGPPGHVTFGYATIAYLEVKPKLSLEAKPFSNNMSRGGFGAPPGIVALPGISKTPTIELISSYGDQGISDATATLVELGPTPGAIKYVSDAIPLDHTNAPCEIHGEIVPVSPDKKFDVQFSGGFHGRNHYVFGKGQWVLRGPQADLVEVCDG